MHRPYEDLDLPSDAEPLVRELIAVGVQLHSALTHMEATMALPGAPRDLPDAPQVLGDLLLGCLEPLARRCPDEVATTAGVLSLVAGVIEDEIFLVPLDPPPCVREPARAERRARRRR